MFNRKVTRLEDGHLREAFVAGMDGCRYGWVVVSWELLKKTTSLFLASSFLEALQTAMDAEVIAVDIPIGLLDAARKGGRDCDILARRLLGGPRASSIFSPPVREALKATSYSEALRMNRESSPHGIGVSRQCFGIFPKLSEVDQQITPNLQKRVIEVHPEICFFEMNNQRPMRHKKKSKAGSEERKDLLAHARFPMDHGWFNQYPKTQLAADDILDACVACWTAERYMEGNAICIPENPPTDSRGLRMEMWR